MNRKPLASFLLIVIAGATAREPLPDGAKRIAALVTAKAAGKSVAVVVRPEAARSLELPSHVAALRAAVTAALSTAHVVVVESPEADRALRDTAAVGLPTAPVLAAAAAATQADALLCLVVRRSGDVESVTAHVTVGGRPVGQMVVSPDMRSVGPAEGATEVDAAAKSVEAAVAPTVAKLAADVIATGASRVVLSVRPETLSDASTAGFEQGVYDAVAKGLAEATVTATPLSALGTKAAAVRPVGALSPANIAKLGLNDGSALLTVNYARRPGGRPLKFAVVTGAKSVATASATLDEWDAAAYPLYPVLNTRVLAFSEAQVGTKVGNGECWTLAADALTDAKARHADGYTFGRKLAPGETPYPGDIFQFTSARFEGHRGGSSWWKTLGSPNHTAVLRRVLGPTRFEILEQNPGPVTADTIDFKDLKSGTWELWRPQG